MDLAWFVPIGLVGVIIVWVGGLKAYRAVAGEPNNNYSNSSAGGSKRNKSSKTKKHIATQSKRRRN